MRHLATLAGGFVIATLLDFALLLAVPSQALASTGSPPTWSDWRRAAVSIFVAASKGPTSDRVFALTVGPVLVGHSPSVVTYDAVPGEPAMPRGSRWVVMTDAADPGLAVHPAVLDGRWDPIHRIAADGRIDWGRIVGAPATLSDLLGSFGPPPTDAATPSLPADQSPVPPWVTLAAAGGLGLALWRLRSRRVA